MGTQASLRYEDGVMHLRRPRAFFTGLVLFVATSFLVARGSLTGVDQYAVGHLMPWLRLHPTGLVWALTAPSLHRPIAAALLTLCVYPAAVLPSALLVGAAAVVLHRRRDDDAAIVWCMLWLVANAIEVGAKWLIERPALYVAGVHVGAFDHSLPSGHTVRSLVAAGALAYTWRWGRLAVVWAAGVALVLVPLGWHTPTDVAAGCFVALMLWGFAPSWSSRSRE